MRSLLYLVSLARAIIPHFSLFFNRFYQKRYSYEKIFKEFYYLFEHLDIVVTLDVSEILRYPINAIRYIFTLFISSENKKVRPNKGNAPKKCISPIVVTQIATHNGMRKERKHFLPKSIFPLWIKICNLRDESSIPHFSLFFNRFYQKRYRYNVLKKV